MQASYLFLCADIPLRVQLNALSSLWTLFSTSNVSFLHSSSPYYLIRNLAILVTHFPNLRPIRHFPSLLDYVYVLGATYMCGAEQPPSSADLIVLQNTTEHSVALCSKLRFPDALSPAETSLLKCTLTRRGGKI